MLNETSETKIWKYPGGEVGVRYHHQGRLNKFRIQSSDDFMALLMLCDARSETTSRIDSVVIPYLPYARQDRVAVAGDPLATRVVARLLSTMGIKGVTTIDLHSDVTKRTFEQEGVALRSVSPIQFIAEYLTKVGLGLDMSRVALVAPDRGAIVKVEDYCSGLWVTHAVMCSKVRDSETGKLTGFKVEEAPSMAKETVERDGVRDLVLCDDIFDGGRTFLGLADTLKEYYGNVRLHLWTTHGIYSNGIDSAAQKFETIGSTDSFLHGQTHPKLTTIAT